MSALLLAGCAAIAPPRPEPTLAVLDSLPAVSPVRVPRTVSIVVSPLQAAPAYDTRRMAYRDHPLDLAYFRDHEWAEPPAAMIGTGLVRTLERSGAFRAVLSAAEEARGAYVLRTELIELLQDDTQRPPQLHLSLRAVLEDPQGKPIGSRDADEIEPMAEATAPAGATAANVAMAKALGEIATFVLAKTP